MKWIVLGFSVFLFVSWNWIIISPLKILVVTFHELSHALMTIITGGNVVEINISANQSGYVRSAGGSRFLILNSGYLGSLLFGLLFLKIAESNLKKHFLIALGAFLALFTLYKINNFFGLIFVLFSSGALVLIALKTGNIIQKYTLVFVGLTSIYYVPIDIFYDTILGFNYDSDARMIANEFGGFTMLWGAIWLTLSFFLLIQFFKSLFLKTNEQ